MARFTNPGDGSGIPGPQGPAGVDGADALWNFLGAYDNGADYSPGDVVTYNGGTYYRVGEPNPGYPPGTSYWTTIALPGEPGPQGEAGAAGGFGSYGSFYDEQTQTITEGQESIGVPIKLRSVDSDATSGFTIIDDSKITPTNTGVYNFAFSSQLFNTAGGGSGQTVEIWFAKNGQPIAESNTRVAVNTNSPFVVAAWNFFQKLNSGDYLEIYWASDNHHIQMVHNTATMDGPHIPSVILTVNQVG